MIPKQRSHVFMHFFDLAKKQSCKRGEPVKCGSNIRLKHLTTSCYLHSHLFDAPISKEHQVFISCFFDKNVQVKEF